MVTLKQLVEIAETAATSFHNRYVGHVDSLSEAESTILNKLVENGLVTVNENAIVKRL